MWARDKAKLDRLAADSRSPILRSFATDLRQPGILREQCLKPRLGSAMTRAEDSRPLRSYGIPIAQS